MRARRIVGRVLLTQWKIREKTPSGRRETPRRAENKQRDARPSVLSQTSFAANYKLPRIKSMIITTTIAAAAADLGENSPLFTITYAQSLLRRRA